MLLRTETRPGEISMLLSSGVSTYTEQSKKITIEKDFVKTFMENL